MSVLYTSFKTYASYNCFVKGLQHMFRYILTCGPCGVLFRNSLPWNNVFLSLTVLVANI